MTRSKLEGGTYYDGDKSFVAERVRHPSGAEMSILKEAGARVVGVNLVRPDGIPMQVLRGLAPGSSIDDMWASSYLLAPFANRLPGGIYVGPDGNTHQLNLPTHGGHAWHGFVHSRPYADVTPFEESGLEAGAVVSAYELLYEPDEIGFPHAFRSRVACALVGATFGMSLELQNLSDWPMFGPEGLHSYLTLGGMPIDGLELAVYNHWDRAQLEDGVPVHPYHFGNNPFYRPGVIGDQRLDDCFVVRQGVRARITLRDPVSGLMLEMEHTGSCTQMYTHPDRCDIGVEPELILHGPYHPGERRQQRAVIPPGESVRLGMRVSLKHAPVSEYYYEPGGDIK